MLFLLEHSETPEYKGRKDAEFILGLIMDGTLEQ